MDLPKVTSDIRLDRLYNKYREDYRKTAIRAANLYNGGSLKWLGIVDIHTYHNELWNKKLWYGHPGYERENGYLGKIMLVRNQPTKQKMDRINCYASITAFYVPKSFKSISIEFCSDQFGNIKVEYTVQSVEITLNEMLKQSKTLPITKRAKTPTSPPDLKELNREYVHIMAKTIDIGGVQYRRIVPIQPYIPLDCLDELDDLSIHVDCDEVFYMEALFSAKKFDNILFSEGRLFNTDTDEYMIEELLK